MTKKQQLERKRLNDLWATRKLTAKEIHRCIELDRKAEYEQDKKLRDVAYKKIHSKS